MQFSQPANGGGFFKPADHSGHLILITRLHGFDQHFDALRGEELPRATVDLVDLDGDQVLRERVYMTHKGLTNKLSSTGPVLGRLGTVTTKSGKDAWSLLPFTAGRDDTKASEWLAAHPEVDLTPGAQASAPPTPAPAPVARQDPRTAPGPGGRMTLDAMRAYGATSTSTPVMHPEIPF